MRRERSGSAWPAAWIFYLMAEDCLLAGLARRIEEFLDCCHSAALIATIHKASIPGPERVLDPAFPLPRLAALLCLSFVPPTLPAAFAHRHSAFDSNLKLVFLARFFLLFRLILLLVFIVLFLI